MEQEDKTKESIQAKAVELFAEKGFDGISVQEICNAVELSKPTLYYYFGSKSGLLKEIRDSLGNELVKGIMKATEYKHDLQKSLTEVYKEVIGFAQNNGTFFKLHNILINAPSNSEGSLIYKEVTVSINQLFEELFTKSCNELGNMRGKEKLYSMMFQNNVNAIALSVLQQDLQITDDLIYQLVHSFMYGIVS